MSTSGRPVESVRSVTVVGAGLAGHSTAKALRSQGFDGALTVVGAERHRPYDRPPLSKEFLLGTLTADDIGLERAGEDLQADWRLGRTANSLLSNGSRHTITLEDGEPITSDVVIIATGSRVRRLPGHGGPRSGSAAPAGVHAVRTLDDAAALKAELQPGARLVVVGAGFIGAEIAGSARALGLSVTVLEAAAAPLSVPLGFEAGTMIGSLHERHGAELRCEAMIAGLTGTDRVTGVELLGGEVVPADIVVVGIGATADTDWLAGSGVELGAGGVLCDRTGATRVSGVYAVGDCAAWRDPVLGWHRRIEHWTDSKDRGPVVAAALLGAPAPTTVRAPYFWSDQYGIKIQFAGRRTGDEELVIESGSMDDAALLATYRHRGDVRAVLAVGRQPEFMRMRKSLAVTVPADVDDQEDQAGTRAELRIA